MRPAAVDAGRTRAVVDATIGHIDQPQRLFLAVRPPRAVSDRLNQLPRPSTHGVRWVPADKWHITLRFLGGARSDEVIDAVDTATLPPVTSVRLGPEVTQRWRVLLLMARGLDDVAAELAVATRDLGTNRELRPFVGHLTLARVRDERTADALIGHRFEAEFLAPAIELVASEQTADGHRYTTIRRWPPIR